MPLMVMSPSNYRRETIKINYFDFLFSTSLFHSTSFLIVGLIEANLQISRGWILPSLVNDLVLIVLITRGLVFQLFFQSASVQ